MKNKNGFTLIELILVILLLLLITLISYPIITGYLDEVKNDLYKSQVNNIILTAKDWAVDNKPLLPTTEEPLEVTLGELIQQGYIENDIINPITKKSFSQESIILITKYGNNYNYQFIDIEDK